MFSGQKRFAAHQQPALKLPRIFTVRRRLRRVRGILCPPRILRKGDCILRLCRITLINIFLAAVGVVHDRGRLDEHQHDIRRFLHTVLIGVRIAFFSPSFVCHRNEHLLQTFRRPARDIRADKLNIAVFRFDRLHRDVAAVSHHCFLGFAVGNLYRAALPIRRDGHRARAAAGRSD